MAHTNVSATISFVKKYPITLCGFSLLFMPSVHRLLLFFTPLLLSTAIFVVAMISWGPNNSSERSTNDDDEWTINGLKDEEGSSEPDPALTVEPDPDLHVEHVETAPSALHAERVEPADPDLLHAEAVERVEPDPDLAVEHHVEPDPDLPVERVEPDPDLAVEHHVEPDPDLHVEHAEPDPDLLHVEHGPELHVEPDPDLHAGELHVEPDPDLVGEDDKTSSHGADGGGHHKNAKGRVLFSDDPKLAKAVERELAGLEASLSSSVKRSSAIEEQIQFPDKLDHNSEPSTSRNVAFPVHHQKAVWQAFEAAA